MPWQTRLLRGTRVWVRLRPDGKPAADPGGRVEIRYKEGGKSYRASLRNLSEDPKVETVADRPKVEAGENNGETAAPAAHAVFVWTDGACTGNPGPMGIGIVILDGKERVELSEFLGHGTNNIAELTAIIHALERCSTNRPVVLHSDSAYSLGFLQKKTWKAKANQELVARLRKLASSFTDLRLVKVAGHAGVPENERCDELARQAIERGK